MCKYLILIERHPLMQRSILYYPFPLSVVTCLSSLKVKLVLHNRTVGFQPVHILSIVSVKFIWGQFITTTSRTLTNNEIRTMSLYMSTLLCVTSTKITTLLKQKYANDILKVHVEFDR